MKKVLSISLGSSRRDHKVETTILGEKFIIERKGTDGDKDKAAQLFSELDGQYDAFGLGGIDLYIWSAGRCYAFRDAKKLIKDVHITPVLDGSGLKNTLERRVINYLDNNSIIPIKEQRVLMVSAVDRFGMAETFAELGADLTLGDLIFGLKIPIAINSIKTLDIIVRLVAPLITKLPFELLYPTGDKQDKMVHDKYKKYYNNADIIAGDFHFIRSYMPETMKDKIIITNTVTEDNVEDLKTRGVKILITTTPEIGGRSFGTNVMEGILVALSGKENLTTADYNALLDKLGFTPRIIKFNGND